MQNIKDFFHEIRFWKDWDSARWKPNKDVPAILVILSFLAYEPVNAASVVFACSSSVFPPPTLFSAHSNLASSLEALPLTSMLLDVTDTFQLATNWFPWLLLLGMIFACLAVPFGFRSSFSSRNTMMVNLCCPLDCYWWALGRLLRHTAPTGVWWGLLQRGLAKEKGPPWVGGTIIISTWLLWETGEQLLVHAFSLLDSCLVYLPHHDGWKPRKPWVE